MSSVRQTLADYSTGVLPRGVALSELGIEDYGMLMQMLKNAGLPRSIVPLASRGRMTQTMLSVADQPKLIRVAFPDAGALISLACESSLDLLLSLRAPVRIGLTDIVEFEVMHQNSELAYTQVIREFIERRRSCIEVMPTTTGSLVLSDIARKLEGGQTSSLPNDMRELSIDAFLTSVRAADTGVPTLVVIEDDWFASNIYALSDDVHLLSTSALIDGLEQGRYACPHSLSHG